MKLPEFLLPILKVIGDFFADLNWEKPKKFFKGSYYNLTNDDHQALIEILSDNNYYIFLSHRRSHFTTYVISLMSFFKTSSWSYWSHTFGNVEGDIDKSKDLKSQLLFVEATKKGTHYSTFDQVFDCDGVAVLEIKGYSREEIKEAIDSFVIEKAKENTPYDILFDLTSEQRMSCVEVWYHALKRLPNSSIRLESFFKEVEKVGNLTPQMFYECSDFKVIFEARR